MILGNSKINLSLRHIIIYLFNGGCFALTTPQRPLSRNKTTATNKRCILLKVVFYCPFNSIARTQSHIYDFCPLWSERSYVALFNYMSLQRCPM